MVAPLHDPATHTEVTVDFAYVYWVENVHGGGGRLYRSRGPGVTPELLVDNPRWNITDIEADGFGGVVYRTTHTAILCCVNILERVTTDASGVHIDRADVQGVEAFAFDRDRAEVLYIDTATPRGHLVRSAPIEDLANDRVLRHSTGPAAPTTGRRTWPTASCTYRPRVAVPGRSCGSRHPGAPRSRSPPTRRR